MIKQRRIFYSVLACMVLLSTLWAQEIPLTFDDRDHHNPRWSPDGSEIAYYKWDATGYGQIYKVDSAGVAETALTSDDYHHEYPEWSTDGNWIVYEKYDAPASGDAQIYKVDSAGVAETALTSDNYHHGWPEWSPDGSEIAYEKEDGPGGRQIYKVDSAGVAETALTSDNYYHGFPEWSPDGNWIVYYKYDATGYSQIYKISSVGIEEMPSPTPNFFSFKVKPTITLPNGVVINYSIKREGKVSLRIYDITGGLVKELVNKVVRSGNYSISWDGRNTFAKKVSSGTYFIRLEIDDYSITKKAILLR